MGKMTSELRRLPIPSLVVGALASWSVSLAYLRLFDSPVRLLVATLTMALVATITVVATTRFVNTIAVLRLAVVGIVLVLALSIVLWLASLDGQAPGIRSPADVVGWVVNGWARMADVLFPLPATAELLALPLFQVWATAALVALACLWSKTPAITLVPLVLSLPVGLYLAGNEPAGRVSLVPFLVGCLTLLYTTGRSRSAGADRGAIRSELASILMLGGAACALGIGASWLATEVLAERRAPAPPPLDLNVDLALSPLTSVSAWLRQPQPAGLFTMDGPEPPTFVRLATLDRYDGAAWTPIARFREAGGRLGVVSEDALSTFDITLENLHGPWLPIPGDSAIEIDDAVVLFNPDTGDVIRPTESDRSKPYRITATRSGGNMVGPSPGTRLPEGVADTYRTYAQQLLDGSNETGDAQMGVLADVLSSGSVYRFDPDCRQPGHSLPQLAHFLGALPDRSVSGKPRCGSPEQFAATFAIMARALGHPSRVVVGFEPERPEPGPDGTFRTVVSSDQVHVRVEVLFGTGTWTSFDPTPEQTEEGTAEDVAVDPVRTGGGGAPTPQEQDPPPPELIEERGLFSRVATPRFIGSALVVLAVGALTVIWLMKVQRRRLRRSQRRPADRAIGAWSEARDHLVEQGFAPTDHLTPSRFAGRVRSEASEAGSLVLESMAPLVDRAIYDPDGTAEQDADRAWELLAELEAILTTERPLAGRVVAKVDPRPLVLNRR